MKLLLSLLLIGSLAMTQNGCSGRNKAAKTNDNCYKGRLEIKGGCMNYTISVVEGNIDTSLIQSSWTDEHSGKTYTNVFALGSKCTFPDKINEGDEFYFVIDSTQTQECAVCMMYYPVPSKSLLIRVISEPCAK